MATEKEFEHPRWVAVSAIISIRIFGGEDAPPDSQVLRAVEVVEWIEQRGFDTGSFEDLERVGEDVSVPQAKSVCDEIRALT